MRWPVGRLCEPRIRYEKGTVPHLETFRLVSAAREKPAHSHKFARPSLQALSTSVGRYIEHGSSVPWGHRDSVDEEGKEECRRDLGTTLAPDGGERSGKVSIDLCLPAGGFIVLPGPRLNSCPPSEQDAPSRSLVPPCDRDTNCACPRLTSLVGIHLLLKLRQSHTSATERDLARRLSCSFADVF